MILQQELENQLYESEGKLEAMSSSESSKEDEDENLDDVISEYSEGSYVVRDENLTDEALAKLDINVPIFAVVDEECLYQVGLERFHIELKE